MTSDSYSDEIINGRSRPEGIYPRRARDGLEKQEERWKDENNQSQTYTQDFVLVVKELGARISAFVAVDSQAIRYTTATGPSDAMVRLCPLLSLTASGINTRVEYL